MLRRFAPVIVIACLVVASLGVFVAQKIISDRGDACLPFLAQGGRYEEAYKELEAHHTNKNLCNYLVQFSNAQDASFDDLGAAKARCPLFGSPHFVNLLKRSHAETVQTRIEACDAAAVDPDGEVPAASARIEMTESVAPSKTSEPEACTEWLASLIQNQKVSPDREWTAFESRHTKKNYCKYLIQFSKSEQDIIDESAKRNCAVRDALKVKHAKTLERRTKACDAAAFDPEGNVSSYNR